MKSAKEIIEIINYDIKLHKKLRSYVVEEKNCIKNDSLEYSPEAIDKRKQLEQEIEQINNKVFSMISSAGENSYRYDEENWKKVTMLMNTLRENIQNTLSIVEKTINTVKKEKEVAARKIKKLRKNKNAMSSYSSYGTI